MGPHTWRTLTCCRDSWSRGVSTKAQPWAMSTARTMPTPRQAALGRPNVAHMPLVSVKALCSHRCHACKQLIHLEEAM